MKKNTPAFTLIELMVAATIFITVMIIVISTFGMFTKMQKAATSNRNLTQAGRDLIDRLTRDAHASSMFTKDLVTDNNNGGVIVLKIGDTPSVYHFAADKKIYFCNWYTDNDCFLTSSKDAKKAVEVIDSSKVLVTTFLLTASSDKTNLVQIEFTLADVSDQTKTMSFQTAVTTRSYQ